MTNQEERELRQSLNLKSKSEIINLFIKLRKMFDKSQERLYRVEQELNDNLSLEDLLENFVDKEYKKWYNMDIVNNIIPSNMIFADILCKM